MNLGLLFCPVVVVQSCMPGRACHGRGHQAHHSTVLEEAVTVQADNELVEMGSQNSDAVENGWLLETQLLRPQMHPETISPWEEEWSSGRCTLLSLHFFLFTYSWALNLLLFTYSSFPYFSKHCQTYKDRKQELPFEVGWFISTACTGSQRWKEDRKDCKQPRNVPRCMLLAGQAIAF